MRGREFENSGPSHTTLISLLCLRCFASVSCAASLAFARVLAFATSVAGLATALALTIVLAFARVFTLFGISHGLKGDARITQRRHGVGTHSDGPS
jgi:hypothetical protein